MKSKKTINRYICLGGTLATLLILVLILLKTMNFVFVSNDDIFLQAILSGKITGMPDAHAIYILYPLAWLIALFYKIFPQINWYGFFIVGMHLVCWGVVLYRMLIIADTKWKQVRNLFLALFFLIFLDLQWLVFSQYTALASIIACTAFFCIITVKNQNRLKEYILPVALFSISFMLRSNAALMCLPFALIFMLFKLIYYYFDQKDIKAAKELVITYAKVLLLLVILFVGTYTVDKLAYQAEEWKYYNEYNDYRTEVYDYYMYPSYEDNVDFYQSIGIEKEEMYLVQTMNLDLNLEITSETLNAIYDRSKQVKIDSLQYTNVSKKIIYDYLDSFEDVNREMIVVYLLYGALLIFTLMKKKNSYASGLILTFLLRTGMRCYLIYMNRFPDRVSSPLTIIELITLFGILFFILKNDVKDEHENEKMKMGYVLGIAIITLFILALLGDTYKENKDRYVELIAEDSWADNVLPHITADPEHTYLFDVYSLSPVKSYVFDQNQIPENLIVLGGWLQESPLLEMQYLNRYEGQIDETFFLTEDTYFIQSAILPITWLEDYSLSMGYRVELEVVDQIYKGDRAIYTIYNLKVLD